MATASDTRRAAFSAGRSPPEYERVERVLGTRSLHIGSPIDLHERIRQGLPQRTAVHLIGGMKIIRIDEGLRALNISSRTWQRLKAKPATQRLDAQQSSRLWNLAEVLAKAEEVFGTRDAAEQWLSTPAIGLDSKRPIDLMETSQGTEVVKTHLERIAFGVYA